ncbi:MAG: YlxR family protein [Ruminococcaceae bacterium]|nr:YlxR family protein [Oscillospiraceae bacterium]
MEQKKRKIPLRQCLGCNEHKPKSELLRVVRSPEGEVSLDFTGKKSGRGAYVCPSARCLARARKSGRIEKNLECRVSDEVYARMEEELTEHVGQ